MAKDAFEKHMLSIWPHISTHILFVWLKITNDHVHEFSHTETSNSSFDRLRLMPLVTLSVFQNIQPAFQLQWQHKITTTTKTTYPLPPAVESRQYVTSLILVDRCHVSKNAMHNQNDSLPHSQNSTDSKPELTLILTNHLSTMLHDSRWQVRCVTTRPAFPHVTPSWTLRLPVTKVSHSTTWLELVGEGAVLDLPNTLEYLGRIKNLNNKIQFLLITNLKHFLQCIYLFPFSTRFRQPSAHHQENRIVSIHHLVYATLCRWHHLVYVTLSRWLSGMAVRTGILGSHLHRVIYTRWYIDKIRFSWWWALGCSKRAEKGNN